MRKTFRLEPDEAQYLFRLGADRKLRREGAAFTFWRSVAARRGLDHKTIIGVENQPDVFTALPLGHGRHWCWPDALKAPPIDRGLIRRHGLQFILENPYG